MPTATIENFFSAKFLRVPAYQRDYAWDQRHVDDLWGDIREALRGATQHYIGTFILARSSADNPYDLVDGQQRLTTLTILLRVLIDHLPPEDTKLRTITEDKYIRSESGRDRLSLLGDNHAFFQELLALKNPPPTTRSQKRLLRAHQHVRDLVATETAREPESARRWINQISRLNVMEFVEENAGNAIRIFETVNDRGRPLATIEKLKSFLIYSSSRYLGGALDTALNERFGRIFRAYDRV